MNLGIIRWRMAASGGVERFIFDIAKTLAGEGIDVTLITEPFEPIEPFAGRILTLPRSTGGRARRFRMFQEAAAQAVEGEAFTLVQSHERLLTADLYRAGDGVHAAWFDRLRRSRPWWRAMGMGLNAMHRLYMETERRMARETAMTFVANSPLVARELKDWLELPGDRIRLIENGVDLECFSPPDDDARIQARADLGIAPEGRVAAYVGSGFERKGAFHLIRALADPALRKLSVIIAGRDKAAAKARSLAGRLGVADRVIFAGPVKDVRPVLHAADLFVLPTLYDPMPNAALEALACGLPVVTTPDAGLAEAIEESGAGAVSSREPDALAATIGALIANLSAAQAAAQALAPRYALSKTTPQWIDLYRELA